MVEGYNPIDFQLLFVFINTFCARILRNTGRYVHFSLLAIPFDLIDQKGSKGDFHVLAGLSVCREIKTHSMTRLFQLESLFEYPYLMQKSLGSLSKYRK